jgi:hypothetical protein
MALVKGTNSYVTVAEADSYFLDRLDVAAWTAADEPTKSQALVTATSMLDDLSWVGTAVSESQSLAFPRSGEYFDPRLGTVVSITGVPLRVQKATYELAYHLLNNDGLQDDTGGVKNISVGPIRLDFIKPPSKIPSNVLRLVKPLQANAGSNSWWRAN